MIRLLLLCLLPLSAWAETAPPASGVEETLRVLDADHDGQVTITEIRVALEARNGKGYRKTLLEDMETKAGTSCGTPFSRSFY